ncbi:DUF3800 domain-containing protein [Lacunimicrobium album]
MLTLLIYSQLMYIVLRGTLSQRYWKRTVSEDESGKTKYYFVDEAGDPNIFNRKKNIIVGSEGASRFFSVGLLEVTSPTSLSKDLIELRQSLLSDPYFKNVPSMQPAAGKTALYFHAKDDLPEVRREVLKVLMTHDLKFFAVIRDKLRISKLVLEHNKKNSAYRYHPNQLYDRCVSRLFKERLHKDRSYRIVFATRGSSDRTAAFQKSLEQARRNFRFASESVPRSSDSQSPIEVVPSKPHVEVCLQATDYFLWCLQRLIERNEARFWDIVVDKVSLVYDIDDLRRTEYGEYYSRKRPLTFEEFSKREPGI